MNTNPLSAYFRQPSLYITLPSRGQWWPDGSLVMPSTGELPVLSMTAADEIMLKTPDALISGEAIVSMIQNCVPNIKDAWYMPTVDLQSVLVAIRIASVGETMQVQTQCANCNETNEYDLDLRTLFTQPDLTEWNLPLTVNHLHIKFQPLNYRQLSHIQNQVFQNQKYLQQIRNTQADQPETVSNSILENMNQIELQSVCDTVHCVTLADQTVYDRQHINEFLLNTEKKVYAVIKQRIDQLRKLSLTEPLQLQCDQCKFKFTSEFNLDYANFFDLSS
jgi:bacterioferritin-associated ferredoxin